ncbi:MAG: hypothetical protein H6737_17955 [Alphaproteobacteria bacterium]|nr:hypothetical protein [Alphaproteobacteria bacterium]
MFELDRTKMIIGAVVLLVGIVVLTVVFSGVNKKSLRAEVPTNVESIRQAEIEYHGAFESYVSAEAAPRDPLHVDSKAVAWKPSAGFEKLSWAPEQAEVRGSYSVNAKVDGFTVTGVCDVDDDQSQARFQATLDQEAHSLTDASVF